MLFRFGLVYDHFSLSLWYVVPLDSTTTPTLSSFFPVTSLHSYGLVQRSGHNCPYTMRTHYQNVMKLLLVLSATL